VKTIQLDEDVFEQLSRLTSPLFSHNDVVRKLLMPQSEKNSSTIPDVRAVRPQENGNLVTYIKSVDFQMLNSGINRYLAVLGWLYRAYPQDFQKVENYKRGNRVYFARSQKEVEDSGTGISAKKIPGSPIWTLATLDNTGKRKILSDLLRLFGLNANDINIVVSTISDSAGRRNNGLLDFSSGSK